MNTGTMNTVDADGHYVESQHVWDYLDPADRKYRPVLVEPLLPGGSHFWLVDGKLRGTTVPWMSSQAQSEQDTSTGRTSKISLEARWGLDVATRLRDMDAYSVGIQAVYSTFFLSSVADRPEVEVALCWAYNRWAADVCTKSGGRLRWVAPLSLLSIPDALDQMRWCKEHGAAGVHFRSLEMGRVLPDPYFYPIYDEASRLKMTIGIHTGNGSPWMCEMLERSVPGRNFWLIKLAVAGAFHSVLSSDLHKRFPDLHFGFVEATASWVSGAVREWYGRLEAQGKPRPEDPLGEHNLWVAFQTNDDIPYLVREFGPDHFVIGTDYGHNDSQAELDALVQLRGQEAIGPEVYEKITQHNPRALYNLDFVTP